MYFEKLVIKSIPLKSDNKKLAVTFSYFFKNKINKSNQNLLFHAGTSFENISAETSSSEMSIFGTVTEEEVHKIIIGFAKQIFKP